MSYQTDFDSLYTANLPTNGVKYITAARMRVIMAYISQYVAWLDTINAGALAFEYEREADGDVTPADGKFSVDSQSTPTQLIISHIDGSGTNLEGLFDECTTTNNGVISIYQKGDRTKVLIFKYTAVNDNGDDYFFDGSALVNTLATATGEPYIISLDLTGADFDPFSFTISPDGVTKLTIASGDDIEFSGEEGIGVSMNSAGVTHQINNNAITAAKLTLASGGSSRLGFVKSVSGGFQFLPLVNELTITGDGTTTEWDIQATGGSRVIANLYEKKSAAYQLRYLGYTGGDDVATIVYNSTTGRSYVQFYAAPTSGVEYKLVYMLF